MTLVELGRITLLTGAIMALFIGVVRVVFVLLMTFAGVLAGTVKRRVSYTYWFDMGLIAVGVFGLLVIL